MLNLKLKISFAKIFNQVGDGIPVNPQNSEPGQFGQPRERQPTPLLPEEMGSPLGARPQPNPWAHIPEFQRIRF